MRKMLNFLLPVLLAALFVGCASTSLTNLTATTVPREPSNMYRIEYQWDSNQQSVIDESITPYVVVGAERYPMNRVKFTDNRWEAFVPVPSSKNSITYYFKVDYKFRRFGGEGENSRVSPYYTMAIQ